MALISCYECCKEVSDRATVCPHCGAPKLRIEKNSIGMIFVFDEKGNEIYRKHKDGGECWYNDKGVIIHKRTPDCMESWENENGSVIHEKLPNGIEKWFDNNGRVIHEKKTDGTEKWYK